MSPKNWNAKQRKTALTATALLGALALAITFWLPWEDILDQSLSTATNRSAEQPRPTAAATQPGAKTKAPQGSGILNKLQSKPDPSAAPTAPTATAQPDSAAPKGDRLQSLSAQDAVVLEPLTLLETKNAHITVPQFTGFASQKVDGQVNARIQELLGTAKALERAEALQKEKPNGRWEVSQRFEAERIGQVYHITGHALEFAKGGSAIATRTHLHIDAQSGAFYTMDDLFRSPGGARTALTGMIDSMIQGDAASFLEKASADPLPSSFQLESGGLVISYPIGSIAQPKVGYPEFLIPYEELAGHINHDGAFWKALTKR